MYCALTVRKLKPGTFEDFRTAFLRDEETPPEGWVRFDMIRNVNDPDEVIAFGFFDGTMEQLRNSYDGYDDQMERIAPFVESVGADGIYEVVEERMLAAS